MKLGFDLTIEQTQKLSLTPELIQAIQILQFNNQELETYVQEQVLTNPVLETENDKGGDEYALPDADRFYKGDYTPWNGSENRYEQYAASDETLVDHLMQQLHFVPVKKACREVVKYVIETLDDNGYLTAGREELAQTLNLSGNSINRVLDIIHSFDPPGVGAENLKECLLIQLEALGELTEVKETVIEDHLEDIAANRLAVIARKLGLEVEEIQEIADEIKALDPKPGKAFASREETKYITPDAFVEKEDDRYIVTINEGSVPHLMVSSYYRQVLNESRNDRNLAAYLNERINTANWLIKSIEQRKQTIFNVVSAVVEYQKDFFDYGGRHIKPMTLRQIAEEVGIHESTVSRSINGKYMQTPRGVFEIKYFFTSGVKSEGGGGISSNSVKKIIRDMIEQENPKKPASDQDMVNAMKEKGIDISRRTVAKYREEMGIPSSQKRKRY